MDVSNAGPLQVFRQRGKLEACAAMPGGWVRPSLLADRASRQGPPLIGCTHCFLPPLWCDILQASGERDCMQ